MNGSKILVATVLLGLMATWARADTVRLVNGDTMHGKVLSMDQKELKLQSGMFGTLAIARDHVKMIAFGDAPLDAQAGDQEKRPSDAGAAAAPGNPFVDHLKSKGIDPKVFTLPGTPNQGQPAADAANGASSADNASQDAVGQSPSQKLDPGMMKQLQQAFPQLATPGVQKYVNETAAGLMSGRINIQDLRKQAVDVRAQLQDVVKDLGPEANAVLMPYTEILDQFIRESDPAAQGSAKEESKKGGEAKSKTKNQPPALQSGR
jgi:hypothetical protein